MASIEAKDTHCLEPLVPALGRRFDAVRSFNPYDDVVNGSRATLRQFAQARLPVVVISSVSTIEMLNLIRPRHTYLCIGLEHGIAPFKSYTYGRGLLASDFYLAPTQGWAERLVHLYPTKRAQIRVGGYPKIEAIRDHLRKADDDRRADPQPQSRRPRAAGRILVMLSWGISEDAHELLPDHGFIDYLLHPADHQKLGSLKFRRARVHVSRPEITYPLIAEAGLILGDFSSLTLECIFLGKRVSFLLDAALYEGSSDVDSTFTDRNSAEFGKIPFTAEAIDPEQTVTAAAFTTLAASLGSNIAKWRKALPPASIHSDFLPPVGADNREICSAEIGDIADRCLPIAAAAHDVQRSLGAVDSLSFLSEAYPALLSRPPDKSGLKHYLPLAGHPDQPDAGAKTIAACRELNRSSEAARTRGTALSEDSTDKILSMIGEVAALGADRTCQLLDAINEQVLPTFHRRSRNEAASEVERIRYGTRLAASRQAQVDDFVELAHAYARDESLSDALLWISKAIEARPGDGELLRFQASVLERLGRFEEAVMVATKARSLDADGAAISSDIARLQARYAADLRQRAVSCDAEGRLACYVQLASSGNADIDDCVDLAQACAAEEKLADALLWISKAVEQRPADGELLRFRASMLERLGRVEEALADARQASRLNADEDAIGADLARLSERLVGEARDRLRAGAVADRLAGYAILLRMDEARPADLVAVAAAIASMPFAKVMRAVRRLLPRAAEGSDQRMARRRDSKDLTAEALT